MRYFSGLYKWILKKRNKIPENIRCPVCGYYCMGKGGIGCIDKPTLYGYDLGTYAKNKDWRI